MARHRKLTAALLAVGAISVGAAPAAIAASFKSEHKCSPGQHGNKHPGFKPGSC